MPLKPGLKPEEVATLFYKYLMENKREVWLETFTTWHQKVDKERSGGSAQLYWTAGRKNVDQHGYSYRPYKPGFLERARLLKRAAEMASQGRDPRRPQPKGQKKLFFQRYTRTGEKTGYPIPIILIKDPDQGGEWRVDFATV